MEDTRLVELFWARDESALTAVSEKYGGLCRELARRLLGSDQDAEECVSDVLLRLWESIPPQRPLSLKAYMLKITRNLTVDRWRGNTAAFRAGELTALTPELEACLPLAPSAEEVSGERQTAQAVDRWLKTLSKDDRTLFIRRYWFGDTVKEIAQSRGVPANRLAQKLNRLRGGLRRALEKEGIVL